MKTWLCQWSKPSDQFKGHKGDQHKGKGGLYGQQYTRSRMPTGGYQPDARGSGYKGTQAAPFPYPSPMYPTFPTGGFMQQPMAGMMPQMWPGAMPQGWSQFPPENPGAHMNPNPPHTPTWGDEDELAETEPSPPPPGTGMLRRERDGGGGRGK